MIFIIYFSRRVRDEFHPAERRGVLLQARLRPPREERRRGDPLQRRRQGGQGAQPAQGVGLRGGGRLRGVVQGLEG